MTETTGNRWLAIVLATLIWALAFWFGLLSVSTARTTAFAIMAVGLVFAIYVLVLVERTPGGMDVAFRAALVALITGSVLLLAAVTFDDERFAVVAVVLAPGLAGATGLAPVGAWGLFTIRAVCIVALAGIGLALYATDETVFGLLAPLYVLPVLGVVDIYVERVRSSSDSSHS